MTNPTMTSQAQKAGGEYRLQEGDDWVCPNCGCEIRVRHSGDPNRMERTQAITCCCGTSMQKEQR